jgi:ABC-2 type transport system permease protein
LRRILLIARRDYLAVVRTKAFIIGLVVFPILFGGGSVGAALLQNRGASVRRVAILDRTGISAARIIQAAKDKSEHDPISRKMGFQVAPRFEFETVVPDGAHLAEQRLELSDRLRRGELTAFLEIPPDAIHPGTRPAPSISYYAASGGVDASQPWLAGAVNDGLRRARLAGLGLPAARFGEVLDDIPVEGMALIERDPRTGAIPAARKRGEAEAVVPIVLVMVLVIIVMVAASPMLSVVAEDKLQRVYEMLLGMATPFELMAGKVVAAIGQSLTSSIFYIIGGLLLLQGMALIGLAPLSLIPWFLVYLLAEVTMLCALGVGLGATCGSPQDAQHLVLLVLFPVVIPLFLFAPVLQQPNGPFATALSLFPLFTPVVMMLRQSLPGGVPAWQPWVGLAGVLIVTPLITWAAARIFRVAILLQGQRPTAAQLLGWAVRG